MKIYLAIFALIFFAQGAFAFKVKSFSPKAGAKQIRQVRIVFDSDVVGIGNPLAPSPANVVCQTSGSGKWITPREWVYDFEDDLGGDDFCTVTMVPALADLSGKTFEGKTKYQFDAGGPRVTDQHPYSTLPEEGGILLRFNAPIEPTAAGKFLAFKVPDIENEVGVKVHSMDEMIKLIKELKAYSFPDDSKQYNRYLLISSKTKFPLGKKIELIVKEGLPSKKGSKSRVRRTVHFQTAELFQVKLSCERPRADQPCSPLSSIRLDFSNPIPKRFQKEVYLTGVVNGETRRWDSAPDYENSSEIYSITFPPVNLANLKLAVMIPDHLTNFDGKRLSNFPKNGRIETQTGIMPALVKFSGHFGVYELNAEPMIPVAVRNVETDLKAKVFIPKLQNSPWSGFWSFLKWFKSLFFTVSKDRPADLINWFYRVNNQKRERSIFETVKNTTMEEGSSSIFPYNRKTKEDFEVVGIPIKEPGFHIIEIGSSILGGELIGPNQAMYVSTSALVTNMAVHFKRGQKNSLVWVTALDTAKPVGGALVNIVDCKGHVYFEGKTDRDGRASFDGELGSAPMCELDGDVRSSGFAAVVYYGKDFSFTMDMWDDGIEPYRFGLYASAEYKPIRVKTVFDRTLLMAGQTVHMKHFLREQSFKEFSLPKEKPNTVRIKNSFHGNFKDFPVEWDQNGTAETTWDIPKDAKLGNYELKFFTKNVSQAASESELSEEDSEGADSRIEDILGDSFSVQEFKIPILKSSLTTEIVKKTQDLQIAKIQTSLNYNAGGVAAGIRGKLSVHFQEDKRVSMNGYEAFHFAGPEVKIGDQGVDKESDEDSSASKTLLLSAPFDFDQTGQKTQMLQLPKLNSASGTLYAELEYTDPSGEIHSQSSSQRVLKSHLLVGVGESQDVPRKVGVSQFSAALLTDEGKPLPDQKVRLELAQVHSMSHRKKLTGGFYKMYTTKKVDPPRFLCEAVTDKKGIAKCEGKANFNGYGIVIATSEVGGIKAYSSRSSYFYTSKSNSNVYLSNGDRMDLEVPNDGAEPDQVIPVHIKAPFEEYIALITVEHQGIFDSFVTSMKQDQPLFNLPIKPEYAPNIFVSVLAVAKRESLPRHDSLVDLGRPSVRMGIIPIKVKLRESALKVIVDTPKKIFQPRDEVTVNFVVNDYRDQPVKNAELIVAVVDDGLLHLQQNSSWNLLENIFQWRSFGVSTSSNILQIVGKRHFGKKAFLTAGGGGGQLATRTLFDSLVAWEPRLKVDGNGRASLKFKLNDSLTSFTIAGVASSGLMKYGTGRTTIQSRKDIMTFAGIPLAVRQGDEYDATMTVKNATEEAQSITAIMRVEGLGQDLQPQVLSLAANQSRTASWRIKVPYKIDSLKYQAKIEMDGKPIDALEVAQKVQLPFVPRTIAGTFSQIDGKTEIPVKPAENVIPESGKLTFDARPSMTAILSGVEYYMRHYPFACLEQKLSKAVALNDLKLWNEVQEKIGDYLDANGILKLYPSSKTGDVFLTSYFLNASFQNGFKLRPEVESQILSGMNRFVAGQIDPKPYVGIGAPSWRVKARVLDATSRYLKPTKDLIDQVETKGEVTDFNSMVFMDSIYRRSGGSEYLPKAQLLSEKMKAMFDARGTQIVLRDEASIAGEFLESRTKATIDYILNRLEFDLDRDDLPRLTQGLILQMKRGHWGETFSNAFGAIALRKFADKFQKDPISGSLALQFGAQNQVLDWSKDQGGRRGEFELPKDLTSFSASQTGTGKPWVFVNVIGALNLTEAFGSGFGIKKKVHAVVRRSPDRYSVGDVLLVELRVKTQATQSNVALIDPLPPGAATMVGGSNPNSSVPEAVATRDSILTPTFQEMRDNFMTFYFDDLSSGEAVLQYRIRLNQSGKFQFPPTHMEAMYATDTYADFPNGAMTVEP